ncbi:HNH endonuclease [Bradyrhizobium sp. USDA 3364]
MIAIRCPDDDAEQVFRDAAVRTRDLALRRALLAVAERVGERADEYLRLATIEDLFRLAAEDPAGVSKHELSKVYDRVLVRGKGRPIYDRLRAGARFRRCPLCGLRDVKTIDHYLSQSDYPELAVFPANLVPSCSDCNKTKLAHAPRSRVEQSFHPYFDNWGAHRILHASVDIDNSIKVSFSIEPTAGVSAARIARARHHFGLLKLGSLYATNAAVELVESKDTFRRNFKAGADVLRSELRHTARSRQRGNLNAWRAALYWGLAASDEFCDGGFELIEED